MRRIARIAYWLIGFAAAAYGLLAAGLYAFQGQLVYRPETVRPELGDLTSLGVREVRVKTEDGLSLLAWYLPPANGRPVIAYFHGNGGSLRQRAERARRFALEGYGVM